MTEAKLERRPLVAETLRHRGESAVVTGLGSPTYDVMATSKSDRNFYLWGAMGGAIAVGLGLALAQPHRRVLVITGDGEAMMGVGSFATVASQAPENLAILILDNESFNETGSQPGLTGKATDLAAMAAGAGIHNTLTARNDADVDRVVQALWNSPGPTVAVAKIEATKHPSEQPPQDSTKLHQRFRATLAGE